MTPSDLPTADEVGIHPGDLFVYHPDPRQGLHPYMWRIQTGTAGSRAAEDVLRDDIVELEPGGTLLILEVSHTGLPGALTRSSSVADGLTALASGGTYWLHLDRRIDRSLTRSIFLVSRL